jgi:hypothetical protein
LRADGVAWVGDEREAVARVSGIDGALTQGALGVFGVDPQAQRAWSVRPPSGGVFDSAPSRIRSFKEWSLAPLSTLKGTPLHDAMLVKAVNEEQGYVALVAQKCSEPSPRSDELYRATWTGFSEPDPILGATASPDGYTVCLLLREALNGGEFLAERDTRWPEMDRVGPCLSPRGEGRILPESVQYAPNGSYIVFVVEQSSTVRDLWSVPSGGNVDRAVKLYSGPLLPSAAIAPDSHKIAVSINSGAQILLLDGINGAAAETLGPGIVGPQSWHPSGEYLVATAMDEARAISVPWGIEAKSPYRRLRIDPPEGLTGACAVSRDGNWVAGVVEGTATPTAVFMRLADMRFDG